MGWIISVGTAGGAGGRTHGTNGGAKVPAMSLRYDADGVALQLRVGQGSRASEAWQAQRIWQKVVSTVVDID